MTSRIRHGALFAALALVAALGSAPAQTTGNLAPLARATASSEYSGDYTAARAADGAIPAELSQADVGKAWAVRGDDDRQTGWFTLEWDQPVRVSEVVYYGRTAWMLTECWREFALYLDNADRPVAQGELPMTSEPQVIAFAPAQVRKLTIRFLSSHGGLNPGASEIEVYAGGARVRRALTASAQVLDRLALRGVTAGALRARLAELAAGADRLALEPSADEESRLLAETERLQSDALDLLSPPPLTHPAWDVQELLFVKQHYRVPGHVYTAFMDAETGTSSTQGPPVLPGGGICRLAPARVDGAVTEVVNAGPGVIMDLDLSYDARELVFSWRLPGKPYHLYRANVDGSGLTQLTDGPYHDLNPCWLPDGGIAFISTRCRCFVLCNVTPVATLHRMDRDGADIRALSANYVNDFTPAVLPDGRLLYTRWEYVDRPAIPIQSLWTIYPDGTNLRVFFGNRMIDPCTFIEARAVPGSPKVLCTLAPHNGGIEGAIGIVDNGIDVNGGAALLNLTPELPIALGNAMPGRTNRTPYPLAEDLYLVSHSEGGRYGLYACTAAGRRELVYEDPDIDVLCPVPLRPRQRPPVLTGTVVESDQAAGRGTLVLTDVTRGMGAQVPRGTVKALRVVVETAKRVRAASASGNDFSFQRVAVTRNGDDGLKEVLGTIPIEADGSAHFVVPAGQPLYFQALDERGMEVRRMRSFVHLAPGERQACVGCHEPRHTSPPNQQPLAARRPPSTIAPPSWGGGIFDFVTHVQPVLDARCVSCHAGPDPAGRLDLSGDKTRFFNMAFDQLTLKGLVSTINCNNGYEANILQIEPYAFGSHRSRLIEVLDAGHYGVSLAPEEFERLVTWIDLNGPYYGTYEHTRPERYVGRDALPAADQVRQMLGARNCAQCHPQQVGADYEMNLTHPEWSAVLTAPLPRQAGGRGLCGEAGFGGTDDPDYQAVLSVLTAAAAELRQRPRMDMPGAQAVQLPLCCD